MSRDYKTSLDILFSLMAEHGGSISFVPNEPFDCPDLITIGDFKYKGSYLNTKETIEAALLSFIRYKKESKNE